MRPLPACSRAGRTSASPCGATPFSSMACRPMFGCVAPRARRCCCLRSKRQVRHQRTRQLPQVRVASSDTAVRDCALWPHSRCDYPGLCLLHFLGLMGRLPMVCTSALWCIAALPSRWPWHAQEGTARQSSDTSMAACRASLWGRTPTSATCMRLQTPCFRRCALSRHSAALRVLTDPVSLIVPQVLQATRRATFTT